MPTHRTPDAAPPSASPGTAPRDEGQRDDARRDAVPLDAAPLDPASRARCAATARWLHAAQALEWLALLAAAAALWRLLDPPADGWTQWTAWSTLVLALPERVLALRLRFDRGLFAELADGRIASLQALDNALSPWRAAPSGTPRPLDARIAGTLRLWRRHAAVVGLQALLCLPALLPGV